MRTPAVQPEDGTAGILARAQPAIVSTSFDTLSTQTQDPGDAGEERSVVNSP
jgi:hypothetical protein